jgi:clan AA aspartic protease
MGHVTARVKIYNPRDKSKYLEHELLVDTGSTYTWIKRDRLEALGVKPVDRRRFKTIEGRIIIREIGEVIIEYLGRKATCIVVFAKEDDHEVLGVTALENLGLEVDPTTGQLREAEAILAL